MQYSTTAPQADVFLVPIIKQDSQALISNSFVNTL